MATRQNPHSRYRRRTMTGGRSAPSAATPPAGPAPDQRTTHPRTTRNGTGENSAAGPARTKHSRHRDARGTLPMAHPTPAAPAPATAPPPRLPAENENDPPENHRAAPAVRDVNDADIDAVLDAVVDAAPPLPYQVRARLAWLLRGHSTPSHRDTAA